MIIVNGPAFAKSSESYTYSVSLNSIFMKSKQNAMIYFVNVNFK